MAKKKKKNDRTLSADKFRSLFERASHGNEDAQADLIQYTNSLSKTTNSRMKALEEIGYDFYNYDRAYASLQNMGRTRFKTNWNMDTITDNFEDFLQSANAVHVFMKGDSTPSQIKARSIARREYLLDNILNYGGLDAEARILYNKLRNPTTKEDKKFALKFERVLSAAPISMLIGEGYGNTDETVESIAYALYQGKTADEIVATVSKYLPYITGVGKYSIEDIWDVLKERGNGW